MRQHEGFLSRLRARCDVIKHLKCQKWMQAGSDGINAVSLSHAARFFIVTLSTNCQSTETSEGFCLLSRACLSCQKRIIIIIIKKTIFPFHQQPLWRHHMAGRQQRGETAFPVNFTSTVMKAGIKSCNSTHLCFAPSSPCDNGMKTFFSKFLVWLTIPGRHT